MTTFAIIWLGQVVSLVGSGLTSFALGVWVFERTGSATEFALIGLAAVLPRVLLSPLAPVQSQPSCACSQSIAGCACGTNSQVESAGQRNMPALFSRCFGAGMSGQSGAAGGAPGASVTTP